MTADERQPQTYEEACAALAQLVSSNEQLRLQNQQLEWQVKQLEKQLYGPTSDRDPEPLSQEQALLDFFPPSQPAATVDVAVPEAEAPIRRPRRQPQATVLETVTERIEPEEKICPHCGKAKCEIGCERSERFEYIPAKVIRHEILRPKLACPCGQGTVVIAPLPPTPIEKGRPGPGLLAHVLLSKYDDHLPLYRQQEQFRRLGVHLPRQTLCDWVEAGAFLLQPLVRQMKQELLAGDYLQVDETPVRVQDPEVQGRCAKGYLWVAGRPGGDVVFEFHPGRGKEYAVELLGGFAGHLQRDGYGVYGSLAKDRAEIQPVGCWAHARRKFIDALEELPVPARWFVTQIRKLYLIESHARSEAMTAEQRHQLRQSLAPPILAELHREMERVKPDLLPQGPLGKAVRYALAEWEPLGAYLKDGQLEIDNNLTENAIRPTAVGKKNWLFLGHPDAGWKSAVVYSIIASCRRRRVDVWSYLKDVFTRLPGATNKELDQFLPARYQAAPPNPSG